MHYPDIKNVLQRITYQYRIVKNILLYKPTTFNKYQNCAQTFVCLHHESICSVSMVYGNDGDSFYNQVGKCYDSIRQYMYFADPTIHVLCPSDHIDTLQLNAAQSVISSFSNDPGSIQLVRGTIRCNVLRLAKMQCYLIR